ncbi:MAG: hypothetical protein ACLRW2_10220 [Parasutterella excrementihominis]
MAQSFLSAHLPQCPRTWQSLKLKPRSSQTFAFNFQNSDKKLPKPGPAVYKSVLALEGSRLEPIQFQEILLECVRKEPQQVPLSRCLAPELFTDSDQRSLPAPLTMTPGRRSMERNSAEPDKKFIVKFWTVKMKKKP